MDKTEITMEFGLNSKSVNIVWNCISTILGLSKWLADEVTQEGDKLVFTWGDIWTRIETRTATIISIEKYQYVRLKWDDDDDESYFWEMKIGRSHETDDLHLIIIDYADSDDEDGLKEIWTHNIEKLHKASGI